MFIQKQWKINLNKFNGLIFSQGIMLKLTQKGVKREDAYKVVQKNAMEVWKHKKNFYNLIIKDKYIKKYLSNSEIKKLFDLNLKNISTLF